MNEIEINPATLAADADRAVADSLLLQPPAPEGAPVVETDSWRPVVRGVTPLIRLKGFPQWKIGADDHTEFNEALTQCLDQIFPGGIAGKYGCWFRLLAAAGMITVINLDDDTGKLPPFGPRKKNAASTANAPAAAKTN